MGEKLRELEEAFARASVTSREAQRDTRDRDRSRGRQRDGEEEGRSWKLEKEFKPTSRMNLEMPQLELQSWERSCNNYYKISKLSQAPFDVKKSAFQACT